MRKVLSYVLQVALLVVVGIGIGMFLIALDHSEQSQASGKSSKSAKIGRPAYTNEIARLWRGDTTVGPSKIVYIQFSVPTWAIDPRVTGQFRARGGSGNDIRTLVLRPTDFENWSNGHKYRSFYDSQKVTVAEPYVKIDPGKDYYLVFANDFSMFSSKTVSGRLDVSYRKPAPTRPWTSRSSLR